MPGYCNILIIIIDTGVITWFGSEGADPSAT